MRMSSNGINSPVLKANPPQKARFLIRNTFVFYLNCFGLELMKRALKSFI